jgi:hypothetical protein
MQAAPELESFAPSAQIEGGSESRGTRSHWLLRPWSWLLGALLLAAQTVLTAILGAALAPALGGYVAYAGFLAAALLALVALSLGVVRLGVHLVRHGTDGINVAKVCSGIGLTLISLVMVLFGWALVTLQTMEFGRGRQLRRRGRVLLPVTRDGADWAGAALSIQGREQVPTGVADQWRENGRTEHASVASFARLTLDLMALGAPPALVAAANQDSLDEIRHTEACFSLAAALDGKLESPGAFPEVQSVQTLSRVRIVALAQLAVSSLVDGALHEGVSARIIAKLARRCEEPTITRVLTQIAADEGRHAAHGWDVVEWCLREGGAPVAYALLGAAERLPGEMHSPLPEAARSGAWERWGIHGAALEADEYAAARWSLVRRVRTLTQQTLPPGPFSAIRPSSASWCRRA